MPALIQDVWLKMHSAEGFTRAQGDLVELLNLYRSVSLGVLESMMRHPQLEKIADAHTKKKVYGVYILALKLQYILILGFVSVHRF